MLPETLGSMTKIRKFFDNTSGISLEPSSRNFGLEAVSCAPPKIRFEMPERIVLETGTGGSAQGEGREFEG
jgi:hypothetical protein